MSTQNARPCNPSRLSRSLAAAFGTLFTAGVVHGAVLYAGRSPLESEHVPGTSAWWPHAVLAAAAVVLSIGVFVHRRRAGRRGSVLLLPIGERAARRVRLTLAAARAGTGRGRALAAAAPAALLLYSAFRVGVQIIGGLDPAFTVNAWGGPTYLGAMACHYLDAGLLMAASAWLLDKILLPDSGESRTGTGTSAQCAGECSVRA
ncbi:hypothetical protein [Gordonia neofelifaecis]|uniref:Uncharacterized protein n=1 Tax=Gordonia neofelifaecis NRRL B-59395 TaxID=644548 RepID=F1YNS2_9ACTN|nr:hypothetical protein [Gordonia neofelifaecis]EGD53679.1 hypothetical protein SCNU_17842 [Gordonia neofelifaecis NRRL B-59395]